MEHLQVCPQPFIFELWTYTFVPGSGETPFSLHRRWVSPSLNLVQHGLFELSLLIFLLCFSKWLYHSSLFCYTMMTTINLHHLHHHHFISKNIVSVNATNTVKLTKSPVLTSFNYSWKDRVCVCLDPCMFFTSHHWNRKTFKNMTLP